MADTAGLFPDFEDVTADFVYVRLHGEEKLYESGYDRQSLERWARRVKAWRHGDEAPGARLAAPERPAPRRRARDVFVYFDNDARVRAPFDAIALRALVDHTAVPRLPRRVKHAGEPARSRWPRFRFEGRT